MEKIKLAVFHYHFVPGGITTVIKLSLISLLRSNLNIGEIALISGRKENSENLLSSIKSSVQGTDTLFSVETVPELDYLSENSFSGADFRETIQKTLEKYRGYIYWIHNHHIAKNPVFTEIVTVFAGKENDEKFFFHIHDFPECSRFANYKKLKKSVENPYPAGNNIKYAVLNSRDYTILKKAGLDSDSLFCFQIRLFRTGQRYAKQVKRKKDK